MNRRFHLLTTTALATVLFSAGSALGAPTAASESLEKCQKTAQKEAGKLAASLHKTMAGCLQKIAQVAVKENQPSIDVAEATSTCLSKFYKIGRTDGKSLADGMENKVRKACDPTYVDFGGAHTADDVLGTGAPGVNQPLDVAVNLDAHCGSFAPGSANLAEWIECMQGAAECAAREKIAVDYGRALEWLGLMDAQLTASADADAPVALAALEAAYAGIDGSPSDDGLPNLACAPSGVPATGQTTSYGAGSDGVVQPGLARRFTDNGDGTITDLATGLMWEKKQNSGGGSPECINETGTCANPHDVDNRYEWCADDAPENSSCDNVGFPLDGAVVSVFLNQLNNRCNNDVTISCVSNASCTVPGGPCGFAGHRDWRLPSLNELESIRNLEVVAPATFSEFNTGCVASCTLTTPGSCSCTVSSFYWSSSTYQDFPSYAWSVYFDDGFGGATSKDGGLYVRAVRGGS